MKEYYYAGDFAGVPLLFAFRHPDSAAYFNGWLTPAEYSGENCFSNIVRVPKTDCDYWIQNFGAGDDGNTEFGMSVYRASDALLQSRRCVIHAAAMLWNGKAWLFAADSGTGKSTQLKHWAGMYSEEIHIMNGDKPVLKIEEDGMVTVHPSPWKGKEEWGDDTLFAPLGGMILLKQGSENRIERRKPLQYAARLLSLFFSAFETKETLEKLCRFEEAIINTVPVWQLINRGDRDSVRITRETLLEWQGQQEMDPV